MLKALKFQKNGQVNVEHDQKHKLFRKQIGLTMENMFGILRAELKTRPFVPAK